MSSGFTTHAGFQSFRGYVEPPFPSCVLAPDFNSIDCWKALDASRNANKAIRQKVPSVLPSGLKVNYFDGLGATRLTITQSTSLNTLTAQTLIGWIKPDADIVTTAKIFEKGLTTDDYTSLSWITDGALVFYRKRATTSPTWTSETARVPVSTWTMYAIAYDSSDVVNDPEIYFNGCFCGVITESAAPVGAISDDASNSIFLGSRSNGSLPFKGYIGQQWEFNEKLTPAQVRIVYNQTRWLYGV